MSNDPEQEHVSDGISEELLNRLAKMPDLQVAARRSAFQFKGQNLDIADIGRQLRVVHVLEGSVRKAGIKLRITVQLIDNRSGYHLWSESYDRDATDVFHVQDEIAGEIARALKAGAERHRVERREGRSRSL
jgi:TolB-like protein